MIETKEFEEWKSRPCSTIPNVMHTWRSEEPGPCGHKCNLNLYELKLMEVIPERKNEFKHMTWIDVEQSLLPNFKPVNMFLSNARDWVWLLGAMYIDANDSVPGREDLRLDGLYDSVRRSKKDVSYRINVVYSAQDILGREVEEYATIMLGKREIEKGSIKIEWMDPKTESISSMIDRNIADWIDKKTDQFKEWSKK